MADGEDYVVRMGVMKIDDLERNWRITKLHQEIDAISVWSLPGASPDQIAMTAQRLSKASYRQYRHSNVGRIRAAGYDIANCDADGHCDLLLPNPPTMADWAALQALFELPARVPALEDPQ